MELEGRAEDAAFFEKDKDDIGGFIFGRDLIPN